MAIMNEIKFLADIKAPNVYIADELNIGNTTMTEVVDSIDIQAYQAYYDTMCAMKNAMGGNNGNGLKITIAIGFSSVDYGGYDYVMGDYGRVLVYHPIIETIGKDFPQIHADTYFTNVKFPPKLTYIGVQAFAGVPLKAIRIPRNVEFIGAGAFNGQITSEIYLALEEELGGMYGFDLSCEIVFDPKCKLKEIPNDCFYGRTIKNIELHEGLERIGSAAFYGTYGYSEIKFPSTLKVIDDYAFSDGGVRTYDLTAFTAGIPFPTLSNEENFNALGGMPSPIDGTIIKVVKGRKAELAAMTNWSFYADCIVEV